MMTMFLVNLIFNIKINKQKKTICTAERNNFIYKKHLSRNKVARYLHQAEQQLEICK